MTQDAEDKGELLVSPTTMDIQNTGVAAKVSVGFNSYSYQGPIPRAVELERYNSILPGAAERILKMAEKEQLIEQEKENQNYKLKRYSVWLGFSGYICALILVAYALWIDKDWAAGVFVAMFSVCTVISQCGVKAKSSKKEETKE